MERCKSTDSVFGILTGPLPLPSCGSRAVRKVKVRVVPSMSEASGWQRLDAAWTEAGLRDVPMCEACAKAHESK